MLKKVLLTCAFSCMMLTFPAPGMSASAFNPAQQEETIKEADGQIMVPANDVPSTEVNMVEESPLAQQMTQEEKMQNAQENDPAGLGVTIVAMCIVVSALAILSILFLFFGKISETFMAHKKRKTLAEDADHPDHTDVDSGEVIAAIAMALAEHLDGKGHDLERTIMTLKRMKRNYSPWNSKIYGLRQIPQVRK